VAADAVVGPYAVVGPRSVVSQSTRVAYSVVGPDTYVGPELDVQHKMVHHDAIWNQIEQCEATSPHASVLGPLRKTSWLPASSAASWAALFRKQAWPESTRPSEGTGFLSDVMTNSVRVPAGLPG
jgi:NDP-sugar pyrophosphorylase family protein